MEETKKPQCLLLYSRKDVYYQVAADLRAVLQENGVQMTTLSEALTPGSLISDTIHTTIENAELIIVDITGNSENVMYELGFARALKKPILIMVDRSKVDIPSDIVAYMYYTYNPTELSPIKKVIKKWIESNIINSKE